MPTCTECNNSLKKSKFPAAELKRQDHVRRCKDCLCDDSTARVVGAMAPAQTTQSQDAEFSEIVQIVKGDFQRRMGGTIITDEAGGGEALSVEFYGPGPKGSVAVEFVQSLDLGRAEIFLRGETFEIRRVNIAVFRAFQQHLLRHSKSKGLTDVASGGLIYEGNVV